MARKGAKRKLVLSRGSDSELEEVQRPLRKRATRSSQKNAQQTLDCEPGQSLSTKERNESKQYSGTTVEKSSDKINLKKEFPISEVEEITEEDLILQNDNILSDQEDSSDDEIEDSIDWETVDLPSHSQQQEQHNQFTAYNDVEVVFEAPRPILKKSKWEMAYQRQLREWIHNCHSVLLIAHYMTRNNWCASQEVQAVCLSAVPEHVQAICRRLDESEEQFKKGVKWLLTWWREYFSVDGMGLVTRAYDEYSFLANVDISEDRQMLNSRLQERGMLDGEDIANSTEFVDKLVSRSGNRDTSAELFVAIARSMGYDTRLVSSLQPIPYRVPAARSEKKETQPEMDDTGSSQENSSLRFPFRTPRPQLTGPVPDGDPNKFTSPKAKPPTVWAEIFDPHVDKWVCVDPIRGLYDQPKNMEPSSADKRNVISYILAFCNGGTGCIDVTRRYASNIAKALKQRERELTKREKEGGMKKWSAVLLESIRPKKMGDRERREEEEFRESQSRDPMPTSIQAFNNHSLYALERHLKKFEVLYPQEPILGHIKGEKIFPRSCVKPVHTAETWMKRGRVVKDGEQPVKHVNARAMTIEKKRAQEIAKLEGQTLQVGCYGEWQTTAYRPPPVVDGKVPRNSYGRVDLFTEDMLPDGAAHIPIQGIAKIARKLHIDFAEAVGFEFVKQRSVPVTRGIVIPAESKEILLEAWQEHECHEIDKATEKQEKEVYARWRKIIKGVLLKVRLDNDYGKSKMSQEQSSVAQESPQTKWEKFLRNRHRANDEEGTAGGGFIVDDFDTKNNSDTEMA